jgi:hypothetical protein
VTGTGAGTEGDLDDSAAASFARSRSSSLVFGALGSGKLLLFGKEPGPGLPVRVISCEPRRGGGGAKFSTA